MAKKIKKFDTKLVKGNMYYSKEFDCYYWFNNKNPSRLLELKKVNNSKLKEVH